MNRIINAAALTVLVAFMAASAAAQQIPADKSRVNSWFNENVKPWSNRKGQLDPALAEAEADAMVVKVRSDGSGQFKTITEALKSVPAGNKRRVVIWIGGGVYKEKVKIDRSKPFITFYGSPNNMPKITYNGDANKYGTVESATVIAESDYFVAANIIFENSSPRPDGRKGQQAVAARISGEKSALYNCKFLGFQDTLCDDTGLHLFKDCYIEGTVDFIFGRGTSLYLNTELRVVSNGGPAVITAHARELESDKSVYSFVHCSVTGAGGKSTHLGRAWMRRSRVVFAYTKMNDVVLPSGWENSKHPQYDHAIFFGEYQNSGPGSDVSGRAKLAKKLTDEQVKPFISLSMLESSKWLLPPPKL